MKKYSNILFSEQAFQKAVHKPSAEVNISDTYTTATKEESIDSSTDFITVKSEDELGTTRSYDEIRESLLGLQDQLKELDALRDDNNINEISFADIEPEVYDESQSRGFGR